MNAKKKIIDTTWDDEIIMNIQKMFRSYSCRGAETIIFPLDFVPKLKPKLHGTLPSPMNLGIKCNKIKLKLDDLKIEGGLE
jgi:hypothetical protein